MIQMNYITRYWNSTKMSYSGCIFRITTNHAWKAFIIFVRNRDKIKEIYDDPWVEWSSRDQFVDSRNSMVLVWNR